MTPPALKIVGSEADDSGKEFYALVRFIPTRRPGLLSILFHWVFG